MIYHIIYYIMYYIIYVYVHTPCASHVSPHPLGHSQQNTTHAPSPPLGCDAEVLQVGSGLRSSEAPQRSLETLKVRIWMDLICNQRYKKTDARWCKDLCGDTGEMPDMCPIELVRVSHTSRISKDHQPQSCARKLWLYCKSQVLIGIGHSFKDP